MRREVAEPAVDDRADPRRGVRGQAADDLADDLPLEGLEAARAEGRALEAQASELVEERVGLHLVAEHRREPAVELELDAVRQPGRDSLEQRIVVRLRVAFGRHEVNAVGVRLDRGSRRGPRAPQTARTTRAPLGGHAIGGVEVVPVPSAEREIAVEGIDQDLKDCWMRAEMRALGRLACLASQALGAHPELAQVLEQLAKDTEQRRRRARWTARA
jgi:hypothetical protein